MTLLRDLIDIPTSVGDADFVVKATDGADLGRYVVTDDLRGNFDEALSMVAHAVNTGSSQAKFLHGSFGSGKSHFMAVLREIFNHNPGARAVRGLAESIAKADPWLQGKKFLNLTFHMLDARSVEQAVLEGYLRQITALHPEAPVPAVHRSDALLDDAGRLRAPAAQTRWRGVVSGRGQDIVEHGGRLARHAAEQAVLLGPEGPRRVMIVGWRNRTAQSLCGSWPSTWMTTQSGTET